MVKFTQDYTDDLLVRMAYHNSAIEGNTMSLPEIVSIILEEITPGNKSVREFYEIDNHKEAFRYILSLYANMEKLSVRIVKKIHSLLLDRLQHDPGKFKTNQNAIVGAEFKTASPEETPMLMSQWVDNINYQLEMAVSRDVKLKILAEGHILFERIHPFADGNGRTGRMILLYQSLLEFDTPIVINNNDRALYIQALAKQEVDTLARMFQTSLNYESERIENFDINN